MTDAPKNSGRLRLRAEDDEDLAVISACLQDAVVAVGDIAYLPAERRVAMVVNRFCWECEGSGSRSQRVLAGLCLEHVRGVRAQGIDRARREHLMELLALRRLAGSDGEVVLELQFSGGQALRVSADRLGVRIEDLEEPYPTPWRPHHQLDETP
ncbi:MAG: DUF2948 family protein [Rhodospirillales bacterium]